MEKTLIASGNTIDEAIDSALAQLGLDRDNVSVQVLQQAKAGFLGIGRQQAKVQVTYEAPDPVPEAPKVALSSASRSKPKPAKKPEAPKAEPKPEAPKPEASKPEAPKPEAPKAEKKPEAPKPEKKERPAREPREKKPQAPKAPAEPRVYAPAEPGSVEEKIEVFLKGLMEHMGSKAIPHCWKEEGNTYQVELVGEDLGYLIGRRGDTLDAIQHLTNYSINRGVEGHIRINVDAESYRGKSGSRACSIWPARWPARWSSTAAA